MKTQENNSHFLSFFLIFGSFGANQGGFLVLFFIFSKHSLNKIQNLNLFCLYYLVFREIRLLRPLGCKRGVGYTSSAIRKMSTTFQMSDRCFLKGVAIG